MSEEWISFLVAWLPFLLLIGALVIMARWQGMRSRGPSGHSLIELYEQQVRGDAKDECVAGAHRGGAGEARQSG
jgi:ATP-dependent Zn protease